MIYNCKDRHEQLPYALLGYHTTARASTGATPYLLVYGTEAVIPAEVEIPSLRIIQEAELDDVEWIRKRYEQLALIDEKRMIAICHGQLYQQRMARAFNKHVLSEGAVALAEMDGQEWPRAINSDAIKRYYV
ncbi:uncharacterized protein LOC132041879 [Lycium ferocissimum]|uniref:uncharacterized protein LOC132041879 n=1 Tax=Lycium ferocissimum TaxID=112874 RepID=UPI0028165391|nr:uncharacterized protein LOC132041879 [Lycium ferocissimum]